MSYSLAMSAPDGSLGATKNCNEIQQVLTEDRVMTTEKVYGFSTFPEWKQHADKLHEKQHELIENRKAQAELSKAGSEREQRRDSLTVEALAKLDGTEHAEAPDNGAEVAELQRMEHVLERAILLQRGRINGLQGRLSAIVCAPLVPEHKELVKAIADAMIALAEACERESEFRYRLEQADVQTSAYLRPMPFRKCQNLKDLNSDASRYLAECRAHGFLPE